MTSERESYKVITQAVLMSHDVRKVITVLIYTGDEYLFFKLHIKLMALYLVVYTVQWKNNGDHRGNRNLWSSLPWRALGSCTIHTNWPWNESHFDANIIISGTNANTRAGLSCFANLSSANVAEWAAPNSLAMNPYFNI